ncbi:hypothetical protein CRG98_018434, partial [Punica granatum]
MAASAPSSIFFPQPISQSKGPHLSPLSLPLSRSHPLSLKSHRPSNLRIRCSSSGDGDSSDIPIEKKYPAFPTVMDINQIREILPHRFPFLLVDR